MRSNSIRSALRSPAAVAVLIAGVVHVPPVAEHLHEAPYIGLMFIGLVVACGALGFLLMWRDTRTVWRLAAAITGMAALAYLASRTVGLPEIGDDIGHWTDPLGTIALMAETATVTLARVALRRHKPNPHATRFKACATARESTSTEGKDDQ